MSITSCVHIRKLNQYIHLIWTQCYQEYNKHWYTYITHYWHMLPEQIYLLHCTYMFHCMYTAGHCKLPSKVSMLQHVFTKLQQNMCQPQISPPYAIYMPYSQISQQALMWKVLQYICHKWTHCHQPCDKEWCTQLSMILMPILKPTKLMPMQPNYITWVWHGPGQPKTCHI